ncbi:MAG: AzlD domain-containing protein [Oscillospiraceae bacterium]|nr:AzlD domain-containing protein [Oscillospiraceae bacterium]
MLRSEVFFLLLGMSLVTYIPRALPAALSEKMKFSSRVEKFLKLIPYTAMAAIIFPGILTADATNPAYGLAGGAVALAFGLRKRSVMVCVLAAVATELLLYLLIG